MNSGLVRVRRGHVLLMGLGTLSVAGSAAMAQSTAYVIDNRGSPHNVAKFPINAPAFNVVGPVTPTCFAINFDATNTLYAVTYAGGVPANELGSVNVHTAAFTAIAPITGDGAAESTVAGLAWDRTTSTMFMLAGTHLYRVDLNSANTTLVAPLTGLAGALWIDIAVDSNGDMYAHDIATDQLVKVDKVTGVVTVLGFTGLAANQPQGMDFDPTTNVLYACAYTGAGAGQFCTVNVMTGAFTPVVSTRPWTPNGPQMEIATLGCYPDCDGDGALTLADFGCFQTRFALGDPYADCDGDTLLTLADFGCFQTKFALGCRERSAVVLGNNSL